MSLGVQSFVDREAASVGRLHKHETVIDDIARLRAAGIADINLDLIAGLPHQNAESWKYSLGQAVHRTCPMSAFTCLRLTKTRAWGANSSLEGQNTTRILCPDEDLVADFYEEACAELNRAGIRQYEISNFSRAGYESRHNLKYWTRQPYCGFGVDAHSMLCARDSANRSGAVFCVRFVGAIYRWKFDQCHSNFLGSGA